MTDDDLVFKALADPTRRHLLDRLFERDGRTLTELEQDLEMTRFGVMKHLRLLEAAGLVVSRKAGRTRLHYLNPVPIQQISDRWIHKYVGHRAAALADLKKALEGTMTAQQEAPATQVYQVFIRSTPEKIWQAITTAEFSRQYFHGSSVSVTGDRYRGLGPGGEVWVEGAVIESEPPKRLVHEWRSLYSDETKDEPASRVTWEVEPGEGGVCLLTVVHDRLENSPKTRQSVSGRGWTTVLSGLKTLLETRTPLFAVAATA